MYMHVKIKKSLFLEYDGLKFKSSDRKLNTEVTFLSNSEHFKTSAARSYKFNLIC